MFRRFVLAFLGFNLLVILWGAWVRISFSGDGCGSSWPLCGGEFIPSAVTRAPWIEWTHRVSTGVFGIAAMVLFLLGFRLFPKRHPIRKSLGVVLGLTFAEALIGALLVKLDLVADNASIARAWVMGVHQITSLTLTAGIFLSWIYADPSNGASTKRWSVIWPMFALFALTSFSGALAALAGTLFPSTDLITGILADFQTESHPFVRLRLSHPMLAALFCAITVGFAIRRGEKILAAVLGVAFTFGVITLLSLSPLWMKLAHLALAHGSIMALVWATPEEKDSAKPLKGIAKK